MVRAASRKAGWSGIAAAMVALMLASCAPAHDALSRTEPGWLAVLRMHGESMPRRTIMALTRGRPGSPGQGREVRIAIEEVGRHASDRVVVLIHGAFASHRTWRFVAGDLSQDHDVVLVDLPGCGESERPAGAGVEPGEYAPDVLAHRVAEAVRSVLIVRADRPRVTLVGHSLGAAVALQMMGDPASRRAMGEVFDQVDRLVLISPLDLDIERVDPEFIRLARVDGMFVAIADLVGLLDERVARAIARSADRPSVALAEDADEKHEILAEWRRRTAAQSILRDAVPMRDGRPDAERLAPLTDHYRAVDRPVLIIHGRRDDVLPTDMSVRLASKLADARVRELPEASHSPQIGHASDCAELIRLWAPGSGEFSDEPTQPEPGG